MTTETKETITLSGTIQDIAFKYTNEGNEFAEVSLDVGRQYPVKCRAFDEDLVKRVHNAKKGQDAGFLINETKGSYQGKEVTYRNIVGITQADPASNPPPPKAKPTQSAQSASSVSDHDRQESIQRQVSLKCAVDLAANGILIPEGEQTIVGVVLDAAETFALWLDGTPNRLGEPEAEGGSNG